MGSNEWNEARWANVAGLNWKKAIEQSLAFREEHATSSLWVTMDCVMVTVTDALL